MIQNKVILLGLDVGERRIGLALADSIGRIAMPLTTLIADGLEIINLQTIILENQVAMLVVGLPRNQTGNETAQSQSVRDFVTNKLAGFDLPISFQDESMTSVLAEEQLNRRKRGFKKEEIDAYAAALILQDYLEANYGKL